MKSKPLTNHSLAVTFQTDHIIEWSPYWTFQLCALNILPSKWKIYYAHPCRSLLPTDIFSRRKVFGLSFQKSKSNYYFFREWSFEFEIREQHLSCILIRQTHCYLQPPLPHGRSEPPSSLCLKPLLLLSGLHPCHCKVCRCNKSRFLKYMCVPSVAGWFGAEERIWSDLPSAQIILWFSFHSE